MFRVPQRAGTGTRMQVQRKRETIIYHHAAMVGGGKILKRIIGRYNDECIYLHMHYAYIIYIYIYKFMRILLYM